MSKSLSTVLFQESIDHPLGRIGPCEMVQRLPGPGVGAVEVAPSYLLMLVLSGVGEYSEPSGLREGMKEGSVLIACPSHRFHFQRRSSEVSYLRLGFSGLLRTPP